MEKMEISSIAGERSGTTILQLKGPLTLQTLFDFQKVLRKPDLKDTIIDLTGVPYIDSAGLGTILSHWVHSQRAGTKFAIVGVSERVQVLFDLTKVGRVLPTFASIKQAEESFSGSSSTARAIST